MSKNNKIILNKDKIEKHHFYRFTKRPIRISIA